jgi:hypothetical protein
MNQGRRACLKMLGIVSLISKPINLSPSTWCHTANPYFLQKSMLRQCFGDNS